ncbi:MAG: SMC-Scp complex subunit ScpB [Lachnospiraceae bacterium]|nr:SMC-Scp complex subunit ScpB [Lachnospiraceae bacterium]
MEINRLKGTIEALLFSAGKSLELSELCNVLEHDKETIKKIIEDMMISYEAEERGIRIRKLEDSYQLCSKEEYYDSLIRYMSRPRKYNLSQVMLETLSIIAYKQPITRQEIEKIRGVKCDHAINKLIEYSLVCETGRLDAIGRPILFGTTEEFLRCFGVESIVDLPKLSEEKMDDFKQEAEAEIQLSLNLD